MRSSARSALLTLSTCLCFAVALFAQSTKQQPVKTPRGSVSGRITVKNKPAPGVAVGLRNADFTNPYDNFPRGLTDAEGAYRITNVPPGTYQVTVVAPAYVVTETDARKSVVVGEDESLENVNFSLVRGGVITGKVTDAEGRPAIAQQVEIYSASAMERRNQQQQQMPVYPVMGIQTDDRGIYRAWGIAAGRYKVAAGRGDERFSGYAPNRDKYKQIFHPDVSDPAKATVVEVSEGSEAKDVDIILGAPVQMFSASGRMVDSQTGAPVPHARFGLQRVLSPQRVEFVNSFGVANARGDFIIEGLIPGKYSTLMFPEDGSDLRADATTFEIIDSDVSGVTIKVSKGATVSGVVILETEDKSAAGKLAEIMMRGSVQAGPGFGNSVSSQIGADGSFRLAGLPSGAVNISIGGRGPYPPKGFSISRIERDGMIVPRVDVKDGEHVPGVKVFIGYGNAVLHGIVKIENGSLPPSARVFLRLAKPGDNAFYMRPLQVDERGRFQMDGIPPGSYELVGQVVGSGIKAPRQIKQPVALVDGVVTDVTITIDLETVTNP